MPTVFDTMFAKSAFSGLLLMHGEPLLYMPCDGRPRPITAIIDRDPPTILDGSGNAVTPSAVIQVYDSRTTGISRKELDIGSDQVRFPLRVGDTAYKSFSLMVLQASSGGVTALMVR